MKKLFENVGGNQFRLATNEETEQAGLSDIDVSTIKSKLRSCYDVGRFNTTEVEYYPPGEGLDIKENPFGGFIITPGSGDTKTAIVTPLDIKGKTFDVLMKWHDKTHKWEGLNRATLFKTLKFYA